MACCDGDTPTPANRLVKFVEKLRGDDFEWVELSHEVSPETPHWVGFKPFHQVEQPLNYPDGCKADAYYIVSQYGTHIDAPVHFVPGARPLNEIPVRDTLMPLFVINVSDKVRANADYELTVADIEEFESKYGKIPAGAFVAMRSDWSVDHADDYENNDADGNPNYPGWSLDALKLLLEDRKVTAIGHEPTDTDAPGAGHGWEGELYVLKQDHYQIEVMRNLDKVPPAGAIISCTWPNVTGGVGFSARCIAIFPKELKPGCGCGCSEEKPAKDKGCCCEG